MFRLSLALVSSVILIGTTIGFSHSSAKIVGGVESKSAAAVSSSGTKRALLIAAWDYLPDGDFPPLKVAGRNPGPEGDIEAVREVLTSKGFAPIKVLRTRQETTGKAIVAAFNALVGETNAGDIVYIHYSGHGSQLPDKDSPGNPNTDVDEPDGLDETLVPTDYGKNGANEIRDDVVNQLLGKLMDKKPANVTAVFDSCHSGTTSRGEKDEMVLQRGKGWEQRKVWEGPKPAVQPAPASRSREESSSGLLNRGAAKASGYFVISAALDTQEAKEVYDDQAGRQMGRLSNALITALNEAGSRTTYKDLFYRVNSLMSERFIDQQPVFEGDERAGLFGGTVPDPASYWGVKIEGTKISLNAGTLQRMTEGSVIALYSAQTMDLTNATPLARAKIVRTALTTSTLQLTPEYSAKVKPEQLSSAKALEEVHEYGDDRIKVLLPTTDRGNSIRASIQDLPLLRIVSNVPWDVRFRPATPADVQKGSASSLNEFILERASGSIIAKVSDTDNTERVITDALTKEAKWKYIKEKLVQTNTSSPIQARFRIIPIEVDKEHDFRYLRDKEVITSPTGEIKMPELAVDDYIAIEVMSTGDRNAYVSVLDLTSDGEVAQLWPDRRFRITDNFISTTERGKWVRLWSGGKSTPAVFHITEPLGLEVFKLIATSEHADFTGLTTRAARGPLEVFIQSLMKGTRARAGTVPPPKDWFTDEFVFTTVARR